MEFATITTLPSPITQIQCFIHSTTNRTNSTGRIPLINEPDFDTLFVGNIYQRLDKIGKA